MDQCIHTLSWSIAGTYCTQCRQYFSIDEIVRLAEGTLKLKSQLAELVAIADGQHEVIKHSKVYIPLHLLKDRAEQLLAALTAYRQKWQGEK